MASTPLAWGPGEGKVSASLNWILPQTLQKNPWIPAVEVIPPTTLFTGCTHPGIMISLALPPEIAVEVRNQFEHMWKELMADVRQCGVGSFLELYRKPFGIIDGGPTRRTSTDQR